MARLFLLSTLLVLFLTAFFAKDQILKNLVGRGIESRLASDPLQELEDGLHMSLCGAGGPLAAPNASGPCVLMIAGERQFVVDAGSGGVRNINRMGFNPAAIESVFITHFHSDHIDGLGEMATQRWAGGGHKASLPVYGPKGIEEVVQGFNQAYSQDFTYRNDHHGDLVADLDGAGMEAIAFSEPRSRESVVLINDNGLTIEAFKVVHSPVQPAVGYRFSYKGRVVVITGDSSASKNIEFFSEKADILLHDAIAPNLVNLMNRAAVKTDNKIVAKISEDILSYHADPKSVATTAKNANVKHLVYYHIVPPLVVPGQSSVFLDGAERIFSEYTIGQDGLMFSMPAHSEKLVKVRSKL